MKEGAEPGFQQKEQMKKGISPAFSYRKQMKEELSRLSGTGADGGGLVRLSGRARISGEEGD